MIYAVLVDKSHREYPIETLPFLIGRSLSTNLRIENDDAISRLHAEIIIIEDQWYIHDKGSKNGTLLNGEDTGTQPVRLSNGDVITLSNDHSYTFYLPEATVSQVKLSKIKGIYIEEKERNVYVDGILVNPPLSETCFKFLSLLASEPDKVFTYETIIKNIYSVDHFEKDLDIPRCQSLKNEISKTFKKQHLDDSYVGTRSKVGYFIKSV